MTWREKKKSFREWDNNPVTRASKQKWRNGTLAKRVVGQKETDWYDTIRHQSPSICCEVNGASANNSNNNSGVNEFLNQLVDVIARSARDGGVNRGCAILGQIVKVKLNGANEPERSVSSGMQQLSYPLYRNAFDNWTWNACDRQWPANDLICQRLHSRIKEKFALIACCWAARSLLDVMCCHRTGFVTTPN